MTTTNNRAHNFRVQVVSKLGAVVFGGVAVVYGLSGVMIGKSVKEYCRVAELMYAEESVPNMKSWQEGCVDALMATVEDENNSFRERNYSIWALGQLGDRQALPLLESLYTGVIPEREPYDAGVSQYELKKAIALVDGGVNATAWLWR